MFINIKCCKKFNRLMLCWIQPKHTNKFLQAKFIRVEPLILHGCCINSSTKVTTCRKQKKIHSYLRLLCHMEHFPTHKTKRLNKSETINTKNVKKKVSSYIYCISSFVRIFSFSKRFSVGSRSSLSQLTCLVGLSIGKKIFWIFFCSHFPMSVKIK